MIEKDSTTENLLKTLAENVVIIDEWITLDTKLKDGELTAVEVVDKFSNFLVAPAFLSMGLLATAEPLLTPYMQDARESFATVRLALVGEDEADADS